MNRKPEGIPAARERVELVINAIDAKARASDFKMWCIDQLKEALIDMHRNPPKSRSKNISRKITGVDVLAVKKLKMERPGLANRRIATELDIADGRITDILNGKYDHKLPPTVRKLFEANAGKPSIRQLELAQEEL